MENQTMTLAEKALLMHEKWNGKLETIAKSKVNSREDLAIAYTPGVAEPCKMIAKDPEAAYKYTMKANTVAVISDGSAVLGLGNIGAYAAMPVMEENAFCLRNSAMSTPYRSVSIPRTRKKSLPQSRTSHPHTAAST